MLWSFSLQVSVFPPPSLTGTGGGRRILCFILVLGTAGIQSRVSNHSNRKQRRKHNCKPEAVFWFNHFQCKISPFILVLVGSSEIWSTWVMCQASALPSASLPCPQTSLFFSRETDVLLTGLLLLAFALFLLGAAEPTTSLPSHSALSLLNCRQNNNGATACLAWLGSGSWLNRDFWEIWTLLLAVLGFTQLEASKSHFVKSLLTSFPGSPEVQRTPLHG